MLLGFQILKNVVGVVRKLLCQVQGFGKLGFRHSSVENWKDLMNVGPQSAQTAPKPGWIVTQGWERQRCGHETAPGAGPGARMGEQH